MNKSERLLRLLTLLRSRRTAITAKALSSVMEVSERTVYRDIQALIYSGVPIDGAAGVGYLLGERAHLPPLMFTEQELVALVAGINMVKAFTDSELAAAASLCEAKIRTVLPHELTRKVEQQPYRLPVLEKDAQVRELHQQLRSACHQQLKVSIRYCDANEQLSQRTLWPLAIIGFFGAWVLLAWCELRQDYRNFRIDRIAALILLRERYDLSETINATWYFEHKLGITDPAKLL